MTTSSIVKRTVPLIAILLVIIAVAVSCTLISSDRDVPSISNGDQAFATYKYNGKDVTISNAKMYSSIKGSGVDTVVKWVDEQILNSVTPDGSSVSYLASALNNSEKLSEVKKEAIYGDLTDEEFADLDAQEKADLEDAYLKNMKSIGLTASLDVATLTNSEKDYFAVVVAREAYAADKLAEEIKAQDEKAASDEDAKPYFTDSKIESYYNSSEDYKDGYWAIVIPFSSENLYKAALSQLGIQLASSTNVWQFVDGGADLTAEEVLAYHVRLYNNIVSKSEAVDPASFTFDNVVTDGKFDASKAEAYKDYFYYTYDELNKISSSVRNRVAGSAYTDFFSQDKTNAGSKVTGFQKKAVSFSSVYYAILKISVVEAADFDTFKNDDEVVDRSNAVIVDIISKLTEEALTESYISSKMADLRVEKGLRFYDDVLEAKYTSSYDSDFEKYKKESKSDVAYIESLNVKLSADEYFSKVCLQTASGVLTDLINREVVLLSDANKIVPNYSSTMSYKDMKKDAAKNGDNEKFQNILTQIQTLKSNFAGNAFSSYGYPATYGWQKFITDFYQQYYGVSVNGEEELAVYHLYQTVLSDTISERNVSSAYTDELWNKVSSYLNDEYNKYFAVKGYHILISVSDKDGKMVEPKDYTAEQTAAAKALYDEILSKIFNNGDATDNRADVLQSLVTAFNNAPLYSLYSTNGSKIANYLNSPESQYGYVTGQVTEGALSGRPYVFAGDNKYVTLADPINVSYYKTLGLSIKYEALTGSSGGDFGPGVMVENFENVAKYLWDNTEKTYSDNAWDQADAVKVATKAVVNAANGSDYLETKFGYHVYVQTSYTGIAGEKAAIDCSATEEVKGEYKSYRLPTIEELKAYLDIINSDTYKEIVEDDEYESGDEESQFIKTKDEDGKVTEYILTPWQRGNISKYTSKLQSEVGGSYVMSIDLITDIIDNKANLTINNAECNTVVDGESLFNYILKVQLEYAATQLVATKSYYADVLAGYGVTVDLD